ncbi:SRPBCC family protein [Kineosporia sp. J2-2]|uniref:SRPBCC family protein n=1 Tax=Kineosporia corallincola TaxID=2835133 RepID=A0ABS5TP02_9ACTN|nr:SRPBCC family protein [Kineosporia corallincola]MBT0772833.1 SRPBCC family protein [Kineosporia corallincola]
MALIEARHEFVLPVAPVEAFALLSDPEQDPVWQTACVSTALLDGPPRVGGHYTITFKLIGKVMPFTVEIDTFEPGVLSEFHSLEGPFSYVGAYAYEDAGEGSTRVRWKFDVDPGDYFGITPKSLVRKLLVSQVKSDTEKLAAKLRATQERTSR